MDLEEKNLLKEILDFTMVNQTPYEICSGKPGKSKEELIKLKLAKNMAAKGLIELEALTMQEVFAKITMKGKILVASL
jgi:hypothetical protein